MEYFIIVLLAFAIGFFGYAYTIVPFANNPKMSLLMLAKVQSCILPFGLALATMATLTDKFRIHGIIQLLILFSGVWLSKICLDRFAPGLISSAINDIKNALSREKESCNK